MNSISRENRFSLAQKFFWRFILLFLLIYILPYDLAFGFTDKFEEWRLWHKPIFWVGEQLVGWEFDYNEPLLGWDSKFEVSRYIFIFILGSILAVFWLFLDSFYIKKSYEKKLKVLVQTFLRYRIAVVMLHYGLAKVFLQQFGTMDIDTLESTIGEYGPMTLMWKYLSFSEELQFFAGLIETIGAILLLSRKTTFLGATLLIIALGNVVLFDIGYAVSVKLYAIQLLLLTLILVSNQINAIYRFFIIGQSSVASKYLPLVTNTKIKKPVFVFKIALILGLGILYAKDIEQAREDYFNAKYDWFSGLHEVSTFVINGDTIKDGAQRRWKKISFNDIQYLNDTFKIEFEGSDNENSRFKFSVDSVEKIITYRDYQDENGPWNKIKYLELDDGCFYFEGLFNHDTIKAKTKIKRLEDYNLVKHKNKWLID